MDSTDEPFGLHCGLQPQRADTYAINQGNVEAIANVLTLKPSFNAVSSTQKRMPSTFEPTSNVHALNSSSHKVIVVRMERRVGTNVNVIESTVHETNETPIKVVRVIRASVNQDGGSGEHTFQSQSLKHHGKATVIKLVKSSVNSCSANKSLPEITSHVSRAASQSRTGRTSFEVPEHSVHAKSVAIRKRHQLTKTTYAAILDAAKKGIYKCEFCYMEFEEEEKYSIHSAKCGYSNSPVEEIAVKKIASKRGGNECAHPLMPVRCAVCNEVKRDKFILRAHVRRVHLKIQNHFCPICGMSFYNSTKCKLHVKSHDAKKQPKREPYGRCALCGLACANKSSLKKHILGVHMKQGEFAAVECNQCGKTFSNKFSLKRHEQKVHMGISNAICDVCGQSFFDNSDLNHHRKTHDKTRPQHDCRICSKTFTSASYLNTIHKRLHTGERPYKCEVCNAKFIRKRALATHAKKHGDRGQVTEAVEQDQELIPTSTLCMQDTVF